MSTKQPREEIAAAQARGDYPYLNTTSDTTLDQPDLDQIRSDRMERNRTFLISVNAGVAAQVLPKAKSNDEDKEDGDTKAAICIQKNYRGYRGRKIYANLLYDKYLKEEAAQQEKMRQQMEEGELLVENHKLEVLVDDNRTTRRNSERYLRSKVITIQRAWRVFQDKVKSSFPILPENHQNVSDSNSFHSNKEREIQTCETASTSEFGENTKSNKEPVCLELSVAEGISVDQGATDALNVSESNKVSLKPTNRMQSEVSNCESPKDVNVCDASGAEQDSALQLTQSHKLPGESDQDFLRRRKKENILNRAHEFAELKRSDAEALPFNLHKHSYSSEQGADLSLDCGPVISSSTCDKMPEMEKPLNQSTIPASDEIGKNLSDEDKIDARFLQDSENKDDTEDDQGWREKRLPRMSSREKLGLSERSPTKARQKVGGETKQESVFDVYNIESELPQINWDTLEEKLKAAAEEEERRQVARRNDREEIRKKLAMGVDDDYSSNDHNVYKKSNLQSRLQGGMNLQICFMNESPADTDSEHSRSPRQLDETDDLRNSPKVSDLVDSDNNLRTLVDMNYVKEEAETDNSPRKNRTKTRSKEDDEDFTKRQAKLQQEAKLALAQAGTMAHMQLEIEKQLMKKSPMAEIVGIPGLGERRRKKLSIRQLQEMNLAQIQVLFNDLHTQIENLNEELVQLLMERDELHMEQDSMLVDVEDLTRRAEEIAEKANKPKDKMKDKMKGKIIGR